MTPTELLDDGNAEPFKACWHGAMLALAGGAALYNAAAYLHRKQGGAHLLAGAVVYGGLTAVEVRMVLRHIAAGQAHEHRD